MGCGCGRKRKNKSTIVSRRPLLKIAKSKKRNKHG